MRRILPSRAFLFYSIIGLSGVGIDYLMYAALFYLGGVHYLVASFVSTSCGITNNFVLNCWLNFKVRDRLLPRFLMFYGVGLVGLMIASAMLYIQVEWLHWHPLLAKLATIIVVVLLQYNLNRRLSFAKRKGADFRSGSGTV